MIFDEIPFELKEHIFTYVSPNEWINTAKVSNEWMDLTLRSIKKVESCHILIFYHLAVFINQNSNSNYTCVSLLTLMPRLEHLECFANTKAFWMEISPICHQLKILDYNSFMEESFDWNKLNISFKNLVELRSDSPDEEPGFLLRILELAPKLQKITLKRFQIDAEWKNKIPKSVKHILLKNVWFRDEHQCSMNNLCEDTSTLETVSALYNIYSHTLNGNNTHFFDAPRLKKLEMFHPNASDILKNAFTKCPNLETIIGGHRIRVTDSWRKRVPPSVKSFKACGMSIANNVRRDFSFNWLFQNYGTLQSLDVTCEDWTGVDTQKFCSTKNLKKLYLENCWSYDDDDDPFSGICFHMIGGSHLVDVEICRMKIGESWRHIFPSTVKRLKLSSFRLSNEAKEVFSPQFICENPSNIEVLSLDYSDGDLPAMDLNAFSRMNKLQELHLMNFGVSGECFQSILTHCFALTNLFIRRLTPGALGNIPRNLVLPSLRTMDVEEPVGQPSLLLQHFPKMRKVDITIVPTKECWFEVMNCLKGVETAKINVKKPSCDLVRSSIENIDDTKFKYLCLSVKRAHKIFTFYLTNSLLYACTELHRFQGEFGLLWIKNYPSSPLLTKTMYWIPASIDELLRRYDYIMAQVDSDDDQNAE